MKPAKQQPIRLGKPSSIETVITRLPRKVYIGANRYDTDNEVVLHLWDDEGKSYDVRFPKVDKKTGLIL